MLLINREDQCFICFPLARHLIGEHTVSAAHETVPIRVALMKARFGDAETNARDGRAPANPRSGSAEFSREL
jgi:hypothetical protein